MSVGKKHSLWVRFTHWIVAVSFLFLLFTGIEILMVHPRLYWGEVGNDLVPALIELPISRNYKHGGWTESTAFFAGKGTAVTAGRTFDIFNENGWGRSLHFLAGWFLVVSGLIYVTIGFSNGHFRKYLLPPKHQRSWTVLRQDIKAHIRMQVPRANGGPDYGLLQRCTYIGVVFIAFPLMIITGFTMAPAITAAFPFLLDLFGGYQSARTIHFFATIALFLFLIVHLWMVIRSGFKKQMLSMTTGKSYEKGDHNPS